MSSSEVARQFLSISPLEHGSNLHSIILPSHRVGGSVIVLNVTSLVILALFLDVLGHLEGSSSSIILVVHLVQEERVIPMTRLTLVNS
jgi:hypothetical protein